MQVPERLALIGGSILLASTLIFTLKSQASSILPKVEHPISTIYQHAGDAQKSSEFDDNFKQAQQKGWTTGAWGSSKYYIDKDMNMHIGSGELQSPLYNLLGSQKYGDIKSINFEGSVKAPSDSSSLIAGGNSSTTPTNFQDQLTSINGLENLDTSQVTNMSMMFGKNHSLQSINVDKLNTSKVTSMYGMFMDDGSLNRLSFQNWDTQNVQDMSWMFNGTSSIKELDLSMFKTPQVQNISIMFSKNYALDKLDLSNFNTLQATNAETRMFDVTNIKQITLGKDAILSDGNGLNGSYQNGSQTLSNIFLANRGSHPGTWVKQ